METKFTLEPVVGWRIWKLQWLPGEDFSYGQIAMKARSRQYLLAITNNTPWKEGWNAAVCHDPYSCNYRREKYIQALQNLGHPGGMTLFGGHWCNHPDANCGFYAAKETEYLARWLLQHEPSNYREHKLYTMDHEHVLGRVELGGTIYECEFGYRAEYARPIMDSLRSLAILIEFIPKMNDDKKLNWQSIPYSKR